MKKNNTTKNQAMPTIAKINLSTTNVVNKIIIDANKLDHLFYDAADRN